MALLSLVSGSDRNDMIRLMRKGWAKVKALTESLGKMGARSGQSKVLNRAQIIACFPSFNAGKGADSISHLCLFRKPLDNVNTHTVFPYRVKLGL